MCSPQHSTRSYPIQPITSVPLRHSSFRSSQPLADVQLDNQPRIVIDRDPALWQHVENILAPRIVPAPTAKPSYPSGWQPPPTAAAVAQLPYFVRRTKNHMVPVYIAKTYRGQRCVTILRLIGGDIWQLDRDLHAELKRRLGSKPIATRVNEMSGQIWIKGDYASIVRDFVLAKGL